MAENDRGELLDSSAARSLYSALDAALDVAGLLAWARAGVLPADPTRPARAFVVDDEGRFGVAAVWGESSVRLEVYEIDGPERHVLDTLPVVLAVGPDLAAEMVGRLVALRIRRAAGGRRRP